jgi:hypothetical protein
MVSQLEATMYSEEEILAVTQEIRLSIRTQKASPAKVRAFIISEFLCGMLKKEEAIRLEQEVDGYVLSN